MDEHVEPGPEPLADCVEGTTPIERRMVMRLMRHWRVQAGARDYPSRGDMTFEGDPDIVSHSWIARLGGVAVPVVEFIGACFEGECGPGLIGRPLLEVPAATLLARATAYCDDVIRRGVPISIGGPLVHRDGRTLLYRSIIVPLADDGVAPSHLLGAANYRAVR